MQNPKVSVIVPVYKVDKYLTQCLNSIVNQTMEELEIISPVISVSCEYKSMVRFGETVVIDAKVASYNGVKLKVVYKMTDKETGELRAVAESSHCFLTMSGKPLSLKRSYPEIDTKFFTLVEDE